MESQPTWVPTAKIEDLFPSPTRTSNSASAAPREEKDVPMGSAPIQLFSIATPNGKKLGIMLEELGVEYDAHGKYDCHLYSQGLTVLLVYSYSYWER